jgi:hypothetical protein
MEHGDNGLSSFAVDRKRAATEGIGEHSIEILRNVRKRHGEFFLAEEPRQQFNRRFAGLDGSRFEFRSASSTPAGI